MKFGVMHLFPADGNERIRGRRANPLSDYLVETAAIALAASIALRTE